MRLNIFQLVIRTLLFCCVIASNPNVGCGQDVDLKIQFSDSYYFLTIDERIFCLDSIIKNRGNAGHFILAYNDLCSLSGIEPNNRFFDISGLTNTVHIIKDEEYEHFLNRLQNWSEKIPKG